MKIAAIAATPEPAATTAATSPEPTADIPSFEGSIATTLIATLGGPAVFIDEKTAMIDGNQARSEAGPQHRQEEGRRAGPGTAADCRSRRARLAREATLTLQQQHANPFALPADARDEVASA